MAAQSATVRYASRGAVSGSNAYDLSRIRDYSHESAVPERIPVRTPVQKPAVKTAPRTVERTAPRTAQRAQKSYGMSLFAVTGFVVVAVMMVFVLLAHVKYNEVTNETVQLQSKLAALTEQERKLQIAYEDAFDVNNVEQYATNVLGMSKPDESQVRTVMSTAFDKAIVVNPENDDTNVSESMVTFLASLVAYFK